MLIDPVTVVAQIINFLVLVVVLKYLLYDRIIAAMDAREQHIADRLADADRARVQADEQAATYERERAELAGQRDRLLDEALADADAERDELTRKARDEVDELRHRWVAALGREQQRLLAELQERVGAQVVGISRRALDDLVDADLDSRAVRVALDRLEVDGALLDLVEQAAASDTGVEVLTATRASPDLRGEIEACVARNGGQQVPITLTVEPSLLCGLELRAAGQAAGWTLAGYLDDLEVAVGAVLPAEDRR